jgi:hypothetical protein
MNDMISFLNGQPSHSHSNLFILSDKLEKLEKLNKKKMMENMVSWIDSIDDIVNKTRTQMFLLELPNVENIYDILEYSINSNFYFAEITGFINYLLLSCN